MEKKQSNKNVGMVNVDKKSSKDDKFTMDSTIETSHLSIGDRIKVRTGWVADFQSIEASEKVASKICDLFNGRMVEFRPSIDPKPLVQTYALENGIAIKTESDYRELYAKVMEKGNEGYTFDLWTDLSIDAQYLDQSREKLEKFGLRSTYFATAILSHFDKFLRFHQGSFQVIPDTYLADVNTHVVLSWNFSNGPTPGEVELYPLAPNTGAVSVNSNGELSCAPGNNAVPFGAETVNRDRWTLLNPLDGKWLSAIGGEDNPVRAGFTWRHAWETFKFCVVRRMRIRIASTGKYWQANIGANGITTFYNNIGANMTFTKVDFPKLKSNDPVTSMFIAPDNSYLSTKYEFINDPNNSNLSGPPRKIRTGWNIVDRHEGFEIYPAGGNTVKLKGPIGWVYVNSSDGYLYADGSSSQATSMIIDYI